MNYRKAIRDDLETLVELRIQLMREENPTVDVDIRGELREYYERELNQTIFPLIAFDDDMKVVATSSVVYQQYPPTFHCPQGIRAYITNVYTLPEYRRQGINMKLLEMLMEEIKKNNISYVWMWATKVGEPMYRKYGFQDVSSFATLDYLIEDTKEEN